MERNLHSFFYALFFYFFQKPLDFYPKVLYYIDVIKTQIQTPTKMTTQTQHILNEEQVYLLKEVEMEALAMLHHGHSPTYILEYLERQFEKFVPYEVLRMISLSAQALYNH